MPRCTRSPGSPPSSGGGPGPTWRPERPGPGGAGDVRRGGVGVIGHDPGHVPRRVGRPAGRPARACEPPVGDASPALEAAVQRAHLGRRHDLLVGRRLSRIRVAEVAARPCPPARGHDLVLAVGARQRVPGGVVAARFGPPEGVHEAAETGRVAREGGRRAEDADEQRRREKGDEDRLEAAGQHAQWAASCTGDGTLSRAERRPDRGQLRPARALGSPSGSSTATSMRWARAAHVPHRAWGTVRIRSDPRRDNPDHRPIRRGAALPTGRSAPRRGEEERRGPIERIVEDRLERVPEAWVGDQLPMGEIRDVPPQQVDPGERI